MYYYCSLLQWYRTKSRDFEKFDVSRTLLGKKNVLPVNATKKYSKLVLLVTFYGMF